jgi:type II secretory pathway component PulF
MLFIYKTVDKNGAEQSGSIEAPNVDLAISSLQRRGLVIVSIRPEEVANRGLLPFTLPFVKPVKAKEVVMLSRQIASLFEAKVSVLSTFRLLATEVENPYLRNALLEVTDDIKGGIPISAAMAKHGKIFSDFFVNMVRAGEESVNCLKPLPIWLITWIAPTLSPLELRMLLSTQPLWLFPLWW